VVEGPLDAIAVGGVAILGSYPSPEQLRLIEDAYSGKPVIVCLDSDNSKGTVAAAMELSRAGIDARVLVLGYGDPADLAVSYGIGARDFVVKYAHELTLADCLRYRI
jgi:DNA primase